MWFKNKNIRTNNKNTRCAKQMWKQIFIMLTYTNMSMTRLWCKIVPKISVEHNKGNEESYL
jgi:hypothetical protein